MDIIRIYTKAPGEKANVAESIHNDFAAKLKQARIWGSGRFDAQLVRKDYVLQDGYTVELHI